MAKLVATFKVHRAEPRNIVDGVAREERVLLHPLDPHEEGKNDLVGESRSGESKIQLKVEGAALGKFKVGQLVTVSFDIPNTSN